MFAQASCTGAIKTAQRVVQDLGEDKAGSIGGLLELAKCSTRNPERDSRSLLSKKLGLSLQIPIRTIPLESPDTDIQHLEMLSLVDWASFLLKTNTWFILCGLLRPDPHRERCIWREFWRKWELIQPDHPVFAMARKNEIDLGHTAAVLQHGDEGRGRRRQAFMVLSFFSVLGRGTNDANKKAVKKHFLKMKLNYKGHSFCTRMLSGVLPKSMYQKDDGVFQTLLRASCEDARIMATQGVVNEAGTRYWMVCLGTA